MGARSYVITRVGIASLVRWGMVAGALVACLPAFACSALLFSATALLHRTLEGWRDIGISFFGQRLSLNLIELLHLQALANGVSALDALGVFGILVFWLLMSLALGLLVAAALALVGAFYNLTGRLELALEEKSS